MTKAYEEIVDFIAAGTATQGAAQFHASAETKLRVEELLRREKNDALSPEEKAELNDCLQLEHLMRLTKARARKMMGNE